MGAEVTALSHTTFKSIEKSVPQLKRANETLRGPNRCHRRDNSEINLQRQVMCSTSICNKQFATQLTGITSY